MCYITIKYDKVIWHLLRTTFCAHRFFFYSFTVSDGSEGTTAGHVELPCSILGHQGFRSIVVRRAIKQDIDYAKQHHTPHCWSTPR